MASFRDRAQRGFVLGAALIIAVLYFALMELLLIDSSRALNEAQRFRAHVVAATLAESGAELAAVQLTANTGADVEAQDTQGKMAGKMTASFGGVGKTFEITGDGESIGVPSEKAHVELKGLVTGTNVQIDYATHVP